MSYCTKSDILARFDESELINLTDTAGMGEINNDVLQKAIDDATDEINSYLFGIYELPMVSPPSDLVQKACDITRFYLYSNRGIIESGSQVERNFARVLEYLKQVSKGALKLNATLANKTTVVSSGIISSDARQSWSGF